MGSSVSPCTCVLGSRASQKESRCALALEQNGQLRRSRVPPPFLSVDAEANLVGAPGGHVIPGRARGATATTLSQAVRGPSKASCCPRGRRSRASSFLAETRWRPSEGSGCFRRDYGCHARLQTSGGGGGSTWARYTSVLRCLCLQPERQRRSPGPFGILLDRTKPSFPPSPGTSRLPRESRTTRASGTPSREGESGRAGRSGGKSRWAGTARRGSLHSRSSRRPVARDAPCTALELLPAQLHGSLPSSALWL